MTDQRWMRRCLELARKAEGRTSPNPMVGSVVVSRSGRLIAEGYHRKAGSAHGEVAALRKAGSKAKGATLYVNLEPCNHHGRTGPCTEAIARAGIAALVYGAADPIQGHKGGAAWLKRRGLEVRGKVLAAESRELNRGFFSVAERGRPFVVAKAAMSLDGKIATRTGQSKWITGDVARRRGRELRSLLDAIIVGSGTARADDPQLTARTGRKGADPLRVVVDSTLSLKSGARVLPGNSESGARCIVASRTDAPVAAETRLVKHGAEVWRLRGGRSGRVNLPLLMKRLAGEGVLTALIEGGGELIASALAADLVDELQLFVAPLVIGGPAPSWVGGSGIAKLTSAERFEFVGDPERVGNDLRLVLRRGR